jgi:hypothetical protein
MGTWEFTKQEYRIFYFYQKLELEQGKYITNFGFTQYRPASKFANTAFFLRWNTWFHYLTGPAETPATDTDTSFGSESGHSILIW